MTVHHNRLKPCRASPVLPRSAPRPSASQAPTRSQYPYQAPHAPDRTARTANFSPRHLVAPNPVQGGDQPMPGPPTSRAQGRPVSDGEPGWDPELHTNSEPTGHTVTHDDRGQAGSQTDHSTCTERTETRTRSGRVSRAPATLHDYVLG